MCVRACGRHLVSVPFGGGVNLAALVEIVVDDVFPGVAAQLGLGNVPLPRQSPKHLPARQSGGCMGVNRESFRGKRVKDGVV